MGLAAPASCRVGQPGPRCAEDAAPAQPANPGRAAVSARAGGGGARGRPLRPSAGLAPSDVERDSKFGRGC